ncbi:hypothetical protein K493DRAFT_313735 [Basidiobolus meristosporus CBS 931.73]|uniref:VASt domain-containing protein n=1 Tax=Basidiobolus meristosporus CBS 931.73 TaxID=1314790 RepID=A0A1Y1YJQ2_9FUNG|nr:hypothetical protein K493DRAFT_313735 [Basidiobolus meristosporus CBS 931.73]|eukprot:ORX98240.1 hypothetical protein K493DRAFT_313735 [Basidiobolus meristosporus CBS 931.73]
MEDPLIYAPPQTPRKANTKETTRSVSNSPQIQPGSITPSESVFVTPDSSQRIPQSTDILPEEPTTPSQPFPAHTTPERALASNDQIVPQSAGTPISSSNTTKDFFASMLNAATTAASNLTSLKAAKAENAETKSLSSSPGSVKVDDERRQNSTPRFPQVNQPAMATAATDLSTASAITTNPPALTLEQLEQINCSSQNSQVNNSSTASEKIPSDSDGASSEQADDLSNMSRSGSLRKSNRSRSKSDATTDFEDTASTDAANLNAAAKKRNADFHNLFKNVPLNEILIEDYSCAIQKDILVHGRMYITEDYVCFYANIFGFVTNIVVEFKEVVAIERRNMAFFVPNAILISTLHNKYLFASFLTREAAFNCLVDLWRKNHPALIENLAYSNSESNLESPYNVSSQPDSASGTDSGDSSSDEYSDEVSVGSHDEEVDTEDVDQSEIQRGRSLTSNLLAAPSRSGTAPLSKETSRERQNAPSPSPGGVGSTPTTAPETEVSPGNTKQTVCECYGKDHLENPVLDTLLPMPLAKVYELLYGDDTRWVENLLTESKNKDVEVSAWKENKRTLVYIKPINAPIGPKQTKCTVTEEIEHKDFDKYVSVVATVSTPDVPNGTYFNPKTRTCLMHAGDGKTRMIVSCGIVWHKSSWFKGQIERSTLDGSLEAAKDIESAVKRHLVDNPSNISPNKTSETKKRKKPKKNQHRANKHEKKHGDANEKGGQAAIASQSTARSMFDLKNLASSSTLILLAIMGILLVSNIISWYQIHTISKQIRSAGLSDYQNPEIPKVVLDEPVRAEAELVSDVEVSQDAEQPTLRDIGMQLQYVGKLLGNIDNKVNKMVQLTEDQESSV